ncbi:MAG: hypothetical protein QOI31_1015 [Solirubrobacterales bacterium]|jgi:hypothetical protein|nr:hypothetical protein [Solirubrobacterales bacterium]
MSTIRRLKPSPAMAVALAALFISLAGVAWAANLAKNSVTSKTIKNGEVKAKDISPDIQTRAASGSTTDSTLDGIGLVLTDPVSITAPGPGFLLILASYDAQLDAGNGDAFECQILLDNSVIPTSERIIQIDSGTNEEEDCSTHALAPVDEGEHLVNVQQEFADGDLDIRDAQVDVVFVPFDADGP